MSGPPVPMPFSWHRGKGPSFHNDLNDWLERYKNAQGKSMRPKRGNSGDRIQENFSREELRQAMTDFYSGPCGDKWPAARDAYFQNIAQNMGPQQY